jgi:hypothetical protein
LSSGGMGTESTYPSSQNVNESNINKKDSTQNVPNSSINNANDKLHEKNLNIPVASNFHHETIQKNITNNLNPNLNNNIVISPHNTARISNVTVQITKTHMSQSTEIAKTSEDITRQINSVNQNTRNTMSKPEIVDSQAFNNFNDKNNSLQHNYWNYNTSSSTFYNYTTNTINSPTKIPTSNVNLYNQLNTYNNQSFNHSQINFNKNDMKIPKLNTLNNSKVSNSQPTYPYKSLESNINQVQGEKQSNNFNNWAPLTEDRFKLHLNALTMLIANKGENQKKLVSKLTKEYPNTFDDSLMKEKEKLSTCFYQIEENKYDTKILDPMKIPIIYIDENKYLPQINLSNEHKSRGLKAEVAHFKRKIEKDISIQLNPTQTNLRSLMERISKLDLDNEMLKIQQKEIRLNLDEIFSDF